MRQKRRIDQTEVQGFICTEKRAHLANLRFLHFHDRGVHEEANKRKFLVCRHHCKTVFCPSFRSFLL